MSQTLQRPLVTERQRATTALQPPSTPAPYFYLDDAKAEAYLGFPPGSKGRRMKDLRRRGGGPRYIRIGNAPRFRNDWLDEWAEANAVASTSEELARRRA
jgi:hypothetical protein